MFIDLCVYNINTYAYEFYSQRPLTTPSASHGTREREREREKERNREREREREKETNVVRGKDGGCVSLRGRAQKTRREREREKEREGE